MTTETTPTKAGLALLIGVLLITTGCLQGGITEAEDVRTGSIEAMESVDTYSFETETDIEAKAGEGETQDSLSMTAFVRGTASESMGRMKTSSDLVVNEETVDQQGYVENGSAYMRLRNTGEDAGSDRWFEMGTDARSTPVDRHIRILENSEVEYEGEETVGNESAHVLSVDTDTEEYEEFVFDTVRGPVSSIGILAPDLFEDAEVENASMRYRISDDTDRLLRVDSTATVSTSPPTDEGDIEIAVETETIFSSYGDEVDLETPDGIENAEEFDGVASGSSSTSSQRAVEGGEAGAAAYASDSGVVDVMEVRFQESGGNETSTATITTNPISADRITAEAVESGDTASAEDLDASRESLELELDPDGDEVVVTVTRGNETETVYNETVPPN